MTDLAVASADPNPDTHPCRRKVIVLTVSRMASLKPQSDPKLRTVFGELDLAAAFFEQHYVQDSRSRGARPFGSSAQLAELQADIQNARMTSCLLNWNAGAGWILTQDIAGVATVPDRSADSDAAAMSAIPEVPRASESHMQILDSCSLAWVHIENDLPAASDAAKAGASAGIAEITRQLLSRCTRIDGGAETETSPILIVTATLGGTESLHPPFLSPLNENLIRVPLWIHTGQGQPCRINAVSGSRDLIPTIRDALALPIIGLPTAGSAAGNSDEQLPTDSPDTSSVSLLPFTRSPGMVCDRGITIQADDGVAVRTGGYLLFRSSITEPGATGTAESARMSLRESATESEVVTRLYVKPQDVWNVLDQGQVYEDAVAELTQLLESGLAADP